MVKVVYRRGSRCDGTNHVFKMPAPNGKPDVMGRCSCGERREGTQSATLYRYSTFNQAKIENGKPTKYHPYKQEYKRRKDANPSNQPKNGG